MLKADYKFFLSEFHAQGPAFLALELLPQIKLDDIEKIEVFTYHFAWFEIGSGAEKWKPTTRETADHSMPYVVAAVLIDGAYTDAIFAPERFQDRRTLDLMKKITITEDAEFNKRYPRSLPCRMTITLKSGEQKTAELSNPIGHHDRPMSDAQVVEKFRGLAGRKLRRRGWRKSWTDLEDRQRRRLASLFDELRLEHAVIPDVASAIRLTLRCTRNGLDGLHPRRAPGCERSLSVTPRSGAAPGKSAAPRTARASTSSAPRKSRRRCGRCSRSPPPWRGSSAGR